MGGARSGFLRLKLVDFNNSSVWPCMAEVKKLASQLADSVMHHGTLTAVATVD